MPRRVLGWIGGALAAGAIVAVVTLLGIRFLNPVTVAGEAVVTVEEISPGGAIVHIEGYRLSIPLSEGQRQQVRPGTRLQVTYVRLGRRGAVRVDSWRVAEGNKPVPP
jgi:hypothetical protein